MKVTDFKPRRYPQQLAPSSKLTNEKQKCSGTDTLPVAGWGQSFSLTACRGYKVVFPDSHHQAPSRKLAHESGPAKPYSVILTCPVSRDTQEGGRQSLLLLPLVMFRSPTNVYHGPSPRACSKNGKDWGQQGERLAMDRTHHQQQRAARWEVKRVPVCHRGFGGLDNRHTHKTTGSCFAEGEVTSHRPEG